MISAHFDSDNDFEIPSPNKQQKRDANHKKQKKVGKRLRYLKKKWEKAEKKVEKKVEMKTSKKRKSSKFPGGRNPKRATVLVPNMVTRQQVNEGRKNQCFTDLNTKPSKVRTPEKDRKSSRMLGSVSDRPSHPKYHERFLKLLNDSKDMDSRVNPGDGLFGEGDDEHPYRLPYESEDGRIATWTKTMRYLASMMTCDYKSDGHCWFLRVADDKFKRKQKQKGTVCIDDIGLFLQFLICIQISPSMERSKCTNKTSIKLTVSCSPC